MTVNTLPSPAEQLASRKRLQAVFYAPKPEPRDVPKFRVMRKKFVEDPYAPRCEWPRRDWLLIEGVQRRPTLKQIVAASSLHFNVPEIEILSHRRTRNIVIPRQVAMYIAKSLTLRSLPEIARHFDGRDHTTAIASIRRIQSLIPKDESIRTAIEKIKQKLEGWL